MFYLFLFSELIAISKPELRHLIGELQYPYMAFMMFVTKIKPNDNDLISITILLIYCLWVSLTDISIDVYPDTLSYIELFIITSLLTFNRTKRKLIKGDKYNPHNIMLCFYKPKNMKELSISMFGVNACSMSVICGDKWARFRYSHADMVIQDFDIKKLDKNYFLIDTKRCIDKNILNSFEKLEGTHARCFDSFYLRLNCVRAFRYFLEELGGIWKYKFGDFLPAVFLRRRGFFDE